MPKPPINISRHIKKNFINGNLHSKDYYLKDEINYDKKIYEQINKEIIDLFNSITSKNIYKIKTKDVYCPENKCIFYDNNNIYFFDNVHLSYYGSKILSSIILNKIEKIDKLN